MQGPVEAHLFAAGPDNPGQARGDPRHAERGRPAAVLDLQRNTRNGAAGSPWTRSRDTSSDPPEYSASIRKMKARSLIPDAGGPWTLAVVAYRQPIVKADIDRVRGVDAGGTLKGLVEKKLVRIVGRKDVPGKPILYGTTRRFLEIFDLQDLAELPTLREFGELAE